MFKQFAANIIEETERPGGNGDRSQPPKTLRTFPGIMGLPNTNMEIDGFHQIDWRSNCASARAFLADLLTHNFANKAPAIAATLLDRFGSLSLLAHAKSRELGAITGGRADVVIVLAVVRNIRTHMLHAQLQQNSIMSNRDDLIDYLHMRLPLAHEKGIYALYLSSDLRLLHDEYIEAVLTQGAGTREMGNVSNPIIKRAKALKTDHVIIAHNHMSEALIPNACEYDCLVKTCRAAHDHGITVYDQIIVSPSQCLSIAGHSVM